MPPKVDLHLLDLSDEATKFPTNRLPQLNVPIVKRFPEEFLSNDSNHLEEEDCPLPVIPEKTMYNIWEQTQTQTEVRWNKPENAERFASLFYEIQIRDGDSDWVVLAENRLPLYRVYFAEGKAFFGRTKINQKSCTNLVRLRIRAVGVINKNGQEEQRRGPWCENILFSIEAK